MPRLLALAGLAALAVALPAPQAIDLEAIEALPPPPTVTQSLGTATAQTVEVDTAAMIASVIDLIATAPAVAPTSTFADDSDYGYVPYDSYNKVKRSSAAAAAATTTCASQPSSTWATGPGNPNTPNAVDSAQAFLSNPIYSSAALNAPVPTNYTQTFSNLNGSTQQYYYLGYTTLQNYDTNQCAAACGKTKLCQAFNILFERDPAQSPSSGCPDPASQSVIKCVFYGGPIEAGSATNTGQWQNKFQVVIAGSNGYVNNNYFLNSPPPGYSIANLPGYTLNAPLDCNNANTYMGVKYFNSGPFDPSLCAAACTAQTKYNLATGSDQTCQFWTTFMTAKNGVVQAQSCSMYNETWDPTVQPHNDGQYDGQGNHITIVSSYYGGNLTNPGTCVPPPPPPPPAAVPENFILLISGSGGANGQYVQITTNSDNSQTPSMNIVSSPNAATVLTIDSNTNLALPDDSETAYVSNGQTLKGDPVYFANQTPPRAQSLSCSLGGDVGTSEASLTCTALEDTTWYYCAAEEWIVSAPAGSDSDVEGTGVGSEFGPGCTAITLSAIAPP